MWVKIDLYRGFFFSRSIDRWTSLSRENTNFHSTPKLSNYGKHEPVKAVKFVIYEKISF